MTWSSLTSWPLDRSAEPILYAQFFHGDNADFKTRGYPGYGRQVFRKFHWSGYRTLYRLDLPFVSHGLPYVLVTPGEYNYFFASRFPHFVTADTKILAQRYLDRNIKTRISRPTTSRFPPSRAGLLSLMKQ